MHTKLAIVWDKKVAEKLFWAMEKLAIKWLVNIFRSQEYYSIRFFKHILIWQFFTSTYKKQLTRPENIL